MVIESSYQRQFEPKFDRFAPSYAANLTERMQRRKAESNHNSEAFEWQPLSLMPESNDGDEIRPGSVPPHKYKHDLLTQMYNAKLVRNCLESEEIKIAISSQDSCEGNQNKHIPSTPPPSPKDNSDKVVSIAVIAKDPGQKPAKKEMSKCTKTKRPVKPVHPTGQKPASLCLKGQPRPKSVQPSISNRPPFFVFGREDHEPQVAVKKTFNVLSPVDVYPSATQAQKIRREMSARRPKTADGKTLRKSVATDIKDKDEGNPWVTEYRKQFHGFDRVIYERVLTAREAISRNMHLG